MRMKKIVENRTLKSAAAEFIAFKRAQKIRERTLHDYQKYINPFVEQSSNSMDIDVLKREILDYFANIPATSPARYNHPYQYLHALFAWCAKQDYHRVGVQTFHRNGLSAVEEIVFSRERLRETADSAAMSCPMAKVKTTVKVTVKVTVKRRIIPEKVQCDLYDYLTGKEEYSQLFKGSYLTNYSWAETTLGELSSNQD